MAQGTETQRALIRVSFSPRSKSERTRNFCDWLECIFMAIRSWIISNESEINLLYLSSRKLNSFRISKLIIRNSVELLWTGKNHTIFGRRRRYMFGKWLKDSWAPCVIDRHRKVILHGAFLPSTCAIHIFVCGNGAFVYWCSRQIMMCNNWLAAQMSADGNHESHICHLPGQNLRNFLHRRNHRRFIFVFFSNVL